MSFYLGANNIFYCKYTINLYFIYSRVGSLVAPKYFLKCENKSIKCQTTILANSPQTTSNQNAVLIYRLLESKNTNDYIIVNKFRQQGDKKRFGLNMYSYLVFWHQVHVHIYM